MQTNFLIHSTIPKTKGWSETTRRKRLVSALKALPLIEGGITTFVSLEHLGDMYKASVRITTHEGIMWRLEYDITLHGKSCNCSSSSSSFAHFSVDYLSSALLH